MGGSEGYANDRGIRIIGDIPIYVAFDGADSWSHPELFQFDENNMPCAVAGCPPDGFSATGQLWGNPLYNWEYHRETEYAWWMERMEYSFRLYDMVRVDHFRGFDEYYSIPYGAPTAENGHWEKGPGIEIFRKMEERFGKKELPIIAEDLGYLTDTVLKLVKDTGFPGMKVLEFAFDSTEDSAYLPHKYHSNCVVYTGTHDNDTVAGWFPSLDERDKAFAREYMGNRRTPEDEIHLDFVRTALASAAKLAVIPVQDYLGLGTEARINEPSTLGKNWRWRMKAGGLDEGTINLCARMAEIYGRTGRAGDQGRLWEQDETEKPEQGISGEPGQCRGWLDWAVELQSLAQAGLFYTENEFDRERFEQIREIAAEMVSFKSGISMDKVKNLFCCEFGYQTPKLDSRAAIFKDGKILLVKENTGTWSLPGGWVDPGLSVKENIIKEVKEEAGLDADADMVIAVQDREKHNLPVYAYKICKIFVLCSVAGGAFTENLETFESRYFGLDELPELAEEKTTREQIEMCFEAWNSKNWKTLFD